VSNDIVCSKFCSIAHLHSLTAIFENPQLYLPLAACVSTPYESPTQFSVCKSKRGPKWESFPDV